eukprot:1511592-Rhodomonas_salina.2
MHVRYYHILSPYACSSTASRSPYTCPVLTQGMLLPGTKAAVQGEGEGEARVQSALSPYALSCTHIAYGAVSLRAPYAMSGTDIAHHLRYLPARPLRNVRS